MKIILSLSLSLSLSLIHIGVKRNKDCQASDQAGSLQCRPQSPKADQFPGNQARACHPKQCKYCLVKGRCSMCTCLVSTNRRVDAPTPSASPAIGWQPAAAHSVDRSSRSHEARRSNVGLHGPPCGWDRPWDLAPHLCTHPSALGKDNPRIRRLQLCA